MAELYDYIKVIPNVLGKEFCGGIINNEKYKYEIPLIIQSGSAVPDTKLRNCLVATLFKKDDEIVFKAVEMLFRKYCENLQEGGLLFTSISGYSSDINDSGYQLLKYEKGGFYKPHSDDHANNPRRLSISFLLNEEYDGGEFQFFGDYKINGKTGSAIVFPSNFCYPHEVLPVSSGTRHSIVTWVY